MRKTLALVTVLACCSAFALPTLAAGREAGRPHRFVPEALDAGLVRVHNPLDGRTWAAWGYRNGGEFDLALSFTTDGVSWSEPTLFGLDNASDQVEPTFALDPSGTLYLAFTDRGAKAIRLSVLPAGGTQWSTPALLTNPLLHGHSPALAVVGDRLVVAFRSKQQVLLFDVPLFEQPLETRGINDGPDPTGLTEDDSNDTNGGVSRKGTGRESGAGDYPLPLPRIELSGGETAN